MNVQVGGHLDDVPGAGLPVVGEVHVVLVVEQTEADLVPGEGPGAELHDAGLLVEGEVRHVNCAGGLQREKSFNTDIGWLGAGLSVVRTPGRTAELFTESYWVLWVSH